MKRAFLIEMAVFRDYAKQLLLLGLVVSVCIGLGMGTPLATPATLTCMFFMMASMGLAAYDELNHWGLFRLTMPLARRDVVLGRYAAIIVFGLLGTVTGLAGMALITAGVTMLGIGGEVGAAFTFDADLVGPMVFVTAFTMLIGSVVAGVVTPIYFRLGQTRATQILPTVIVLLFVIPVVVLGNSGMLDGGIPGLDLLSSVLEALETPAGMAAGVAACVAVSAVVLAASAALSLKLYERREL